MRGKASIYRSASVISLSVIDVYLSYVAIEHVPHLSIHPLQRLFTIIT